MKNWTNKKFYNKIFLGEFQIVDKNYTTDAINLRSYDLSDSDKIVIMYSKDRGIIRSVAKGVKKPKSKLGVVSIFGLENDPSSEETYNLLYSALNKISNAKERKDVLIAVIKFQLKMMLIAGISPELDKCLHCGKKLENEDIYFSKERCGVFCSECNKKYYVPLKMHHRIRDFLSAMLQFDFNEISEYDEKATDKVCIVCFNLLKEYISNHSDKKFKTDKVLAEIL